MDALVKNKLDRFFKKYTYQEYKKGQIIARADETPTGVFYLQKGKVKRYVISKMGGEIVVSIFKPVSFFPMSWAMSDNHNNYYYEAMTNVELWIAPKLHVIEFIKKEKDVLYDLLARVFRGTEGVLYKMIYLMAGNARGRLVVEILINARRFGQKQSRIVVFPTTEKDLATQTGLSRETVSREIKNLKEKKLISFENKSLSVYNMEKLEQEIKESLGV